MWFFWKKSHPLDNVAPSKVLDTVFKAFGCCCRHSGMLPFTIGEDGYAHYSFFSRPMINLGIYTALFITLSTIYVPYYINHTAMTLQGNMIDYITENVFVGSQYIGTLLSLFLVPSIAKGITKVWNRLMPVIITLINEGHGDIFREPYTRSRVSLLIFLIYSNAYAVMCWIYIVPSWHGELGATRSELKYWIHSFGYFVFFFSFTFHLVHSLVFIFFVFTIRTCFQGLMKMTLEPGNKKVSIPYLVWIYDQLSEASRGIGYTYGIGLLFQLIIMMIACLMNVFTIMSQFAQRDPLTTIVNFLAYSLWLLFLSEAGERFSIQAKRCAESIRQLAYTTKADDVTLHQISNLKAPILTAANFFPINRGLMISTAATFATYCVVMIQFKLNGNNGNFQPLRV